MLSLDAFVRNIRLDFEIKSEKFIGKDGKNNKDGKDGKDGKDKPEECKFCYTHKGLVLLSKASIFNGYIVDSTDKHNNREDVIKKLYVMCCLEYLNKQKYDFCVIDKSNKQTYYTYVPNDEFVKYLLSTMELVKNAMNKFESLLQNRIGHHTGLASSLYESLKLYKHKDVQMFLSSPKSFSMKTYDSSDIKKTRKYIESNGINYYTHSPYIINLCNPKNEKALTLLKKQLRLTTDIGGKGVVVHIGSALKLSFEEGFKVLVNSVNDVIKYAEENKTCPLILETSVGEGTEICWKCSKLIRLYNTINSKYCKVCVDTCHVFAAGYLPSVFIERLIEANVDVVLVHFNDSVKKQGSHADRHAYIGTGEIGFLEMIKCFELIDKHKISIVTE